jgi:hypothetical protein
MCEMATGKSIPPFDSSMHSDSDAESQAHTRNLKQGLRYRVGMAYPIKLVGTDEDGEKFSESSMTQFVMRDGITAVSSHRLAAGSQVRVILAYERSVVGQVVGQTGLTKSGNVYAISVIGDPSVLWGINFPDLSERDRLELNCVLGCSQCKAKAIVQLTAVEHELLSMSERVARHCTTCKGISVWKRVLNSLDPATAAQQKKVANRRRNSRVSVKLWGYIVEGGNEDSVPIIDMSRSGIRFRSTTKYEAEQVVQVAVAYMAGTANIFVPGKIVWRSGDGNAEFEYGLRFMSRSPIL